MQIRDNDKAALEGLNRPVWVFNAKTGEMVWANCEAHTVWRTETSYLLKQHPNIRGGVAQQATIWTSTLKTGEETVAVLCFGLNYIGSNTEEHISNSSKSDYIACAPYSPTEAGDMEDIIQAIPYPVYAVRAVGTILFSNALAHPCAVNSKSLNGLYDVDKHWIALLREACQYHHSQGQVLRDGTFLGAQAVYIHDDFLLFIEERNHSTAMADMCLPHGPDPLSISGALLYATALEHESEPQKLPLEEQPIQKIKSPRIHSLQLGNIGNNGNVRRRVMEAVMDVVPDLLILKTVDGQYIDGNQAFARFMGMDIADIIGRYDYELLDTLNTEKIRQWDQQVSDHQHACQYELALKSPATQKEITFDFLKIPVILPDLDEAATTAQTTNPQKRLAVVTVGRDISENKRVQARLQDQERLFHDMFETNMAVKLVIDPSTGQIVDANSAAANFYGIDKERIRQFKISFFNMSPPEEVQRQMAAAHKGERRYFEFKHRNMSGELRDVEVYSGPVHFRGRTYLYSIIHDVSSRKKAEAIIKHQANYDSLTDLPNRNLFMDRLQQTVALAQQDGRMVCVLFVDLDRFKPINDTMGHEVGDAVLEEVAERLRDSCRNSDTVARFGGDEFVIMLPHVKNIRAAQKVSEKILNALSRPFIIKNDEIFISASIGISICPNDTTHWEDMVKHADVAMYQAKEAGRDQYRFFTEEMDREARSRLRIESELRNALERRELRLVYQPILCTRQKKITHAEALLRWDHHIMGSISPMTFIPIAEETGLIANIGEWVLQEAVQTAALSQKYGVSVAANVSSRQCRDGRHAQIVQNLLSHTALTPSQLHLEITENIMLDDVPGAIDGLQDLRKLGVKVSVDDFGTGYSSLSYLRRFPVDTVKIDKSFVTDMTTSSGSMALVEAIIKMAHALKLKVIAEGVETYQQYLMLVGLQCDYIQGYYISRPLEKDAFLDMIAQPEILKTLEVV